MSTSFLNLLKYRLVKPKEGEELVTQDDRGELTEQSILHIVPSMTYDLDYDELGWYEERPCQQ